ncbi:molybdopterin-guanine dinucleotide biosynthesis protein B [Desulfogranum japonicum]|uniref:molybdopterin-guanine dinucleotide biosynthesis protein B n=1 Tax=Desulfogranum japonicum TaxID=231447 RepID=UPI000418DCD9|nr:molybdopterin-guanine dinucleotide biosynthesis protein B [Desulfogranum japonicum]
MLNSYDGRDQRFDSTTQHISPLKDISPSIAATATASKHPPAVAFIARSGTGKTTLLIQLIAELKSRGYRVGAVKHGPPNFEIDHPGKDSYRFTQAGADNMLVCSDNKLAFVKKQQQAPPLDELLAEYFPDVDIILVEGFKSAGLPKIEIHRHGQGSTLLCRGEYYDPNLLAVVTDSNMPMDVPRLDLHKPEQIIDFLLQFFAIA